VVLLHREISWICSSGAVFAELELFQTGGAVFINQQVELQEAPLLQLRAKRGLSQAQNRCGSDFYQLMWYCSFVEMTLYYI
jgi:hypothetical protein